MTPDDARRLAGILARADGGCTTCVADLVEMAEKEWPGIPWRALCAEHMDSIPGYWVEGRSIDELHARALAYS